MKTMLRWIMVGTALCFSGAGFAQVPAGAPAGTTGLCNDGTYYSGATKKGACHGHKGVKEWYGAPEAQTGATAPTTPAKPASATAPAPAAATVAKPAAAAAPAPAAAAAPAKTAPAPAATAAPGGGPGKVWVNTSSKVYHCPNDKWYGTTKQGEYMSEADAKAKGYHADHGKACQ